MQDVLMYFILIYKKVFIEIAVDFTSLETTKKTHDVHLPFPTSYFLCKSASLTVLPQYPIFAIFVSDILGVLIIKTICSNLFYASTWRNISFFLYFCMTTLVLPHCICSKTSKRSHLHEKMMVITRSKKS